MAISGRVLAVALLVFLQTLAVAGEPSMSGEPTRGPFSLAVSPSLAFPIDEDIGLAGNTGLGADISAYYKMPFFHPIIASASLGWSATTVGAVSEPPTRGFLSNLRAGLALGFQLGVLPWLSIRVLGTGGYFHASLVNCGVQGEGSNPYVGAAADLIWNTRRGWGIGAGALYRSYLGLYSEWALALGTSYEFRPAAGSADRSITPSSGKPKLNSDGLPTRQGEQGSAGAASLAQGAGLEIASVEFGNVFPVLFKYYKDHSLGRVRLLNRDTQKAENIIVRFLVKQYMDNEFVCPGPQSLGPGEEKAIDLVSLFRSNILEISEPTIVSANVSVEYVVAGERQRKDLAVNLRVYDRNALTWEDDRGAAAFVTAKDPTVLKFSKNVAAMLKGKAPDGVNAKLLQAAAIHEALRVCGVSYVVDPARPFEKALSNRTAVDFLQFPQQTLDYRAGDCDDLTILYCALMEAVSVETALITIPGHIFMAFSTGLAPEEAGKAFQRPSDLIFQGGSSWIPVEVTEREGGFLKAWEVGAREWRENAAKAQARLYPISECWQVYEAVGFSGAALPVALPEERRLVDQFMVEVTGFIDREIGPRVAALQEEIRSASDINRPVNRLGVLYAQYGLLDRAEKEFSRLVSRDYVPALVNMGNLLYKRNNPRGALAYYQRAQKMDPRDPSVLLGLIRAYHGLEDYREAGLAYAALQSVDPQLASQFSYLAPGDTPATTAGQQGQAEEFIRWVE